MMVSYPITMCFGMFPFCEYVVGKYGKNWWVFWALSLKSITSKEKISLTLFEEME